MIQTSGRLARFLAIPSRRLAHEPAKIRREVRLIEIAEPLRQRGQVDVVDAVVDTGSPMPPPPPQADNVPTVPRMAVNITARLDLKFNL